MKRHFKSRWPIPIMGFALTLAAGCTHWGPSLHVIAPESPLAGPMGPAKVRAYVGTSGDAPIQRLDWLSEDKVWDGDAVVRKAVKFLMVQGVWDHWKSEAKPMGAKPAFTEKAKYIVCLDPLIVIGPTHQRLRAYQLSHSVQVFLIDETGERLDDGQAYATLPFYFFSGLRLPWHEDLQWFSPDMNVGPEPLSKVQTGAREFRIQVPWGLLILQREHEDLVVSVQAEE